MESINMSLLPGVYGSYLAAIKHCVDDTSVVHCHLGSHRQLRVCPHSGCEARKGFSCLSDSLVELCIKGEVVSDG